MFPTFHLALSFLLAFMLSRYGLLDGWVFALAGGVLPDLDFLISRMHRGLPSHTPFFWALVSFAGLWLYRPLFFVGVFGFIHVLVDSLDWGVMAFYPFRWGFVGFKLLSLPDGSERGFLDFLGVYWGNRTVLFLEANLMVIAAITAFIFERYPF